MNENEPMEAWLREYGKDSTRNMQRKRFLIYLKWNEKTPKELVKEFDQKKTRSQILAFQNYLLNEYQALDKRGKPKLHKGLSQNTTKAVIGSVRAFYTSQCETVRGLKGKVVKGTIAKGEHTFSRNDLAKMWHIANTRNKAILSVACALGWEASQVSEMKREFFERLVRRARSEELEFIGFDWERPKTGALTYGILTPCTLDSLERWLEKTKDIETEWLWCNGNGSHLSDDALNDVLKSLVKEANIVTTGTIRFHLLRKWLISTLSSAGLVEFETKIIVGKEIPLTDSTYLVGLKQSAFEKYCRSYSTHLSLVAYSNNYTKIDNVAKELEEVRNALRLLFKFVEGDQGYKAHRAYAKLSLKEKGIVDSIFEREELEHI